MLHSKFSRFSVFVGVDGEYIIFKWDLCSLVSLMFLALCHLSQKMLYDIVAPQYNHTSVYFLKVKVRMYFFHDANMLKHLQHCVLCNIFFLVT